MTPRLHRRRRSLAAGSARAEHAGVRRLGKRADGRAGEEFDGLTELIVTRDMSERKAKMIELGEAFIALPGGTGTLEEITEVMSKVSLKHLSAPCILYDLNGYYEPLRVLLRGMIDAGLSSEERQRGIYFAANLDEIRAILGR